MRFLRWGLITVGLGVVLLLGYFVLIGLDLGSLSGNAHVKPLDEDDQEIALIEPATNADEWERLVAAVQQLERDWPGLYPETPPLHVSLEGAFPRLTADVPEIGIHFGENTKQILWLRWYKISSDHDSRSWIDQLRARALPPLAIIGGGTSGRAIRLARALEEVRTTGWSGSPPVLLISTATAEHDPRAESQKLIELYPSRSFRYSFTNRIMAKAVLVFLGQNPQVWVHKHSETGLAVASLLSQDPWQSLGFLFSSGQLAPFAMHTIHWEDDSYSRDLADAFRDEFARRYPESELYDEGSLPYSVGDFYHPTPPEQAAVSALLSNRSPFPPHSLLVLPANAPRMRRILGNLRSRAPLDVRNLLVVNGDSISFNTVYRDRDFAWNIQDLPFSLVFFAHRNPIDTDAGFAWQANSTKGRSSTGTHDLLLGRDMIESILHAAFAEGKLLREADPFLDRLRQSRWLHLAEPTRQNMHIGNASVHAWARSARPLFDASGDRQAMTGEHVVWLRPNFSGDRLDLLSTMSVWEIAPGQTSANWRLVAAHDVPYNQARQEAE